jgi:putative transposase
MAGPHDTTGNSIAKNLLRDALPPVHLTHPGVGSPEIGRIGIGDIPNFKIESKRMKQSKFTEGQIVAAIRKQEAGQSVKDISRELGISEATFYNWKAKYGGMEVSEVKRVKELETELAQYKKMYAELSFDHQALKNVFAKKW